MADYVLVKIPELTPATAIADADLLVIEKTEGTRYITFANLKSSIPNYGYLSGIFTSADLVANVGTFTHSKNTRLVKLTIWNPVGVEQKLLQPYIVDANNIAVDFRGDIEAGDWEYLCEFWVGSGATEYPDPTYELKQTKLEATLNPATKNAALTILSYNFYQDNNLVNVSLAVSTSAAFAETGSGAILGIMSVAPLSPIYFPGAIRKVSFYESAWGLISDTGEIKLFLGKANETYIFNFTYPLA